MYILKMEIYDDDDDDDDDDDERLSSPEDECRS